MPGAAAPTAAALAIGDLGKARSNAAKPDRAVAQPRSPAGLDEAAAEGRAENGEELGDLSHGLAVAVIALWGRRSLVGGGDRFSAVSKDRFTGERRQGDSIA